MSQNNINRAESDILLDGVSGYNVVYSHSCTEQQSEIITACMLGGDDANKAFNQSITLCFSGKLSVPALQAAFQKLIDRHDAMRTLFDTEANRFLIVENIPMHMDLIAIPEDVNGNNEHLNPYLKLDASISFDLRKGPLFKAGLFSAGENKHYLLLTLHHLIADGWSLGLLLKDLSQLYNLELNTSTSELDLPQRFKAYCEKEFEFIQSSKYSETEQYWLKTLADYSPSSGLLYDNPRPSVPTYKSNHISFPLSTELFDHVKNTGKIAGSSVLITMVSLFEVLQYKMTGNQQFIVGIPAAGQLSSGFEQLMGHCVGMLPVKADVNKKLNIIEYLRERKEVYTNSFEHKRITFGSILKKLKFNRDRTGVPLIPVTFNIDRPLSDGVDFQDLEFALRINPREYSSFEMILNLSRVGNRLVIECDYNEALFETSSVMMMLNQYAFISEQLCNHHGLSIEDSTLFDSNDLRKKLEEWNSTNVFFPRDQSLSDLFEQSVAEFPENTAIEFKGDKYTYQEINEKANRIARFFIDSGLKQGDIAGVMLDRGPELLVCILAVSKAGATYLPLDREFPIERIRYILEDSGARFLITSQHHLNELSDSSMIIQIDTAWKYAQELNGENLEIKINPLSAAYLIYTSGSTGKPKGVLVTHRNLVNILWSIKMEPGFKSNDRLLAVTTISFDIAGLELYLPLITGGTLVLSDSETSKNGELLMDLIRKERITMMQATPATYKMLLANAWKGSSEITLLCGGEALTHELAMALQPQCKALWNMYGPTETTIWSCAKKISSTDKVVTIGRPINNTEVLICDANLNIVPVGKIGEICIGGEGLSQGYFNRKELTEEKFVKHPYKPDALVYRSGDLGKYLDNGEIVCLGRLDTQVKVRGFRIEVGEIEFTLTSMEEVRESVVVAKEWKKDDVRLIAFLLPEDPSGLEWHTINGTSGIRISSLSKDLEELIRSKASLALPDYMMPSNIVFIEKIPLTPNGKIDRNLILSIDVNHLMTDKGLHSNAITNSSSSSQWSALELQIKPLWEETLGIKNADRLDNFFSSGGHSLIGIELMQKIDHTLKTKLPLSSLFAQPNIAGLAELIESNKRSKWKYLVPIKPDGTKPPLFLVHGLGLEVMVFKDLANVLDLNQPLIGIQAMGVNGDEKPSSSIEEIASHYVEEILLYNPEGPYHIGGFSAGIAIAFEVAIQIKSMGKSVITLANFDFSLEHLRKNLSKKDKIKKLLVGFVPGKWHAIQSIVLHPELSWKFQKNYFKYSAVGLLRKLGFEIDDGDPPSMDDYFRIMEHYMALMDLYEIKPYNGTMDLFNSRIKLYYIKDKKTLGWKPFILKGIRIHPVQGQHETMILPPHSDSFGQTLQEVLNTNLTQYTYERNTNQNKQSPLPMDA